MADESSMQCKFNWLKLHAIMIHLQTRSVQNMGIPATQATGKGQELKEFWVNTTKRKTPV